MLPIALRAEVIKNTTLSKLSVKKFDISNSILKVLPV